METKKILKGTYGDLLLPMHIFTTERTDNIVVNIHGSYGDIYSGTGKYLRLARGLVENKTAHVVLYQSTRENSDIQPRSYEYTQALFKDKTFEQELEDLKIILRFINENSQKIFLSNKPNIIIIGFPVSSIHSGIKYVGKSG